MKQSFTKLKEPEPHTDLRTGRPYAKLMRSHGQFASKIAEYFGVDAQDVIPTPGATGAIEAVRNRLFRLVEKRNPVLLTVSPGYWRARESFQGFGFRVIAVETEPGGFNIDESALISKAAEVRPDALYLSLPNNPTGAVFDPERLVDGLPATMPIIFDLTLPSSQLNTRELTGHLYRNYAGREKLFFVGSTSKSHNTAEYRIGWTICARPEDAGNLRQENRNVVSSLSVEEACKQLDRESPVNDCIEHSFHLLRQQELRAGFEVIQPRRRVQSSYVLLRFLADTAVLRTALKQHGIAVMWGSEFGLTDQYVRLETSEPENIGRFIGVLTRDLRKRQWA
jgi:aspartate/methionine/tyrosine aminotransferase